MSDAASVIVNLPGQSELRDFVSVKDFGAVGDGVTDDTAAFNLALGAALTQAEAGFRSVIVPAGTYRIDGKLYLRRSQALIGEGHGVTRLDMNGASGHTYASIVCGANSLGVADTGGQGWTIADIQFYSGSATNARIDTTDTDSWVVARCMFTAGSRAIVAAGTDGLIVDNVFDLGTRPVEVAGGNIIISNNRFYNALDFIVLVAGAYNVLITSNQFEFMGAHAVLVDTGATNVLNVRVANNQFWDSAQDVSADGVVCLRGTGTVMSITGNDFTNNKAQAIYLVDTTCRVTIESNAFCGVRSNATYNQTSTMQGVEISGGALATIRSNHFDRLPGKPILFSGTAVCEVQVRGNTFNSNTEASGYEIGITNNQATSKVEIGTGSNGFSGVSRALVQPQATVPVYGGGFGGQATLVAGTVTVAYPLARASSKIVVTRHTDGGTVGASYSVVRTAGTGFTITSKDGSGATQAADTSVVNWTLELAGT